jgi:hypothetical protein
LTLRRSFHLFINGMMSFARTTTLLVLLTLSVRAASGEAPHFTEQSEAAGVSVLNTFGGEDKTYILEAHGSGAGFFDYDNDGDLDLYLVNGSDFEHFESKSGPGNSLFKNGGDGTFADITEAAAVGDAGWGAGCAVGDIDNDGYRDLYVTNYRANLLYQNDASGTFADITATAGVAGDGYSAAAAFFDYDNDGDLDLYVTNYVDFDLAANPKTGCNYVGGIETYCGPLGMEGDEDVLYRNEGDNTFTDVTVSSGVSKANSYFGLGVVPVDYDQDGDLDIYVANDVTPNVLFDNTGDGTFRDRALVSGLAYSGDGQEEAGMGIGLGDLDNDDDLDIYVTHFFRESNTLYRNQGGGRFVDQTVEMNLEAVTMDRLGWGTTFADFDNDGDLDLFVANGHVFPEVDAAPTGTSYRQLNQLFLNDGPTALFRDASAEAGPGMAVRKVSRGASFGDYDNDGDVDIFVVNLNDTPTLLRNDLAGESNWLVVLVAGGKGVNRDGVGTRVRLRTADGVEQLRVVDGAGSYISHSDIRVHFGLGASAQVTDLSITWPDGAVQELGPFPANKLVAIRQTASPQILELGQSPQ